MTENVQLIKFDNENDDLSKREYVIFEFKNNSLKAKIEMLRG